MINDDTFVFDEAQVRREADCLEEQAQKAERLSRRMEDALQQLNDSWEGDRFLAFSKKGASAIAETQASARKLRGYADQLRELIQYVRRLDERNAEIARNVG